MTTTTKPFALGDRVIERYGHPALVFVVDKIELSAATGRWVVDATSLEGDQSLLANASQFALAYAP